jgi:hypothetical protein
MHDWLLKEAAWRQKKNRVESRPTDWFQYQLRADFFFE